MKLTDTQTETFITLGVIGRIRAYMGVECPDCHAQPGQTCHTNGRDRGARFHANRKRAGLDDADIKSLISMADAIMVSGYAPAWRSSSASRGEIVALYNAAMRDGFIVLAQ